jgi:hypothetical protein
LNEHIEDLAFVIDGAPQIHPSAGDPNYHLVEMPSVARAWAALPQPARDRRAEFQHSAPHRFIGDVEPALCQKILYVAIAQGEAEIQPYRVLDNSRRKPMSAVRERGHAVIISRPATHSNSVSVTMPGGVRSVTRCTPAFSMPRRRR